MVINLKTDARTRPPAGTVQRAAESGKRVLGNTETIGVRTPLLFGHCR
jgi:hypothetical protein